LALQAPFEKIVCFAHSVFVLYQSIEWEMAFHSTKMIYLVLAFAAFFGMPHFNENWATFTIFVAIS
jgi:hypothetical protein